MRPATKLIAFAAAIALVFGGALAVGAAVPTVGVAAQASERDGAMTGADMDPGMTDMDARATDEHGPDGLSSTDDGLRLVLADATLPRGASELAFRIVDDAGEVVTDVEVEHERPMHVIVVRRDLATYAHVHPDVGPDGTWRAAIDLPRPGVYRVVADVVLAGGDGHGVALGADLFVDGPMTTEPLPASTDVATAGPYEVTLEGTPSTDPTTELAFTVSRDGETVDDLQPYLGAGGHLVAIRAGDLAYTHLHAQALRGDATLRFSGGLPGPGAYRMFLQFRHDGDVRTVAYTVEVGEEDLR